MGARVAGAAGQLRANPRNQYFLTVEQPIFKEEIEKMLLKDQSVDDTLKALKERFAKGVAEVK